MKEYTTKNIRNIAILGHQSSGKTTLAESILYVSGAIDNQGDVEAKNTVSDFLKEEQNKQSSLSMSLLPLEFHNHKFNFLDIPGSEEFVGDLYQALSVVKGAIIVVDATKGIEVGTERVWQEIRKRHIPALIFVNKMDKENVKFENLLEEIRTKLGKKAVPFCWPIGKNENFEGFVNIVEMKAKIFDGKKSQDVEIWEEKKPKIEELRNMMLESVAETSEELLEKYFSDEILTEKEIKDGLHKGVVEGELTPVIVGCAKKSIGTETLIDMLFDYLPAPNELGPVSSKNKEGKIIKVTTNEENKFHAYVFKTTVDPFLGTINYIKIKSGTLSSGDEFIISNSGEVRKATNLYTLRGKQQINIGKFYAGDICTLSKIDGLSTGLTISDPKEPLIFDAVKIPNPILYIAVHPKNKNDEDKISGALSRLNLEDPTFQIQRNKETKQLLLGGQGMTHLNYIIERMKTMFKVDVDVESQKIVYRETIKSKVEAEGKHKKQSGGAGQFGHVWIRFEPSKEKFVFSEEVFGGSVPRNYFPAVEKGLIETFENGPLAGFPVINVKATLYDGSYHSVDSNELSFKLAAGLAFKNAFKDANPTILEPIVKLEVKIKEKYVGDIMGDMNKRRGKVIGMDPRNDGTQVIDCEVPESEIVSYAIDLKAMTQGSGQFSREFIRYDEVPNHLINKIVEKYKDQ
tara:strand:+ start:395 stop:2455 length:2061 start_codon:yes stop_codon:yes gene_type:complete